MGKFYVYIHTSPNKKRYIGVTSMRPENRWKNGFGYKNNKHFFWAIQKYGWENFTHQVFEVSSKEVMFQNEKELIELFRTNDPQFGYNNSTGGEAGPTGCKWSVDSRIRLSESKKGKNKGRPRPDDVKIKIGETNRGKHRSEEAKRKMSEAKRGKSQPLRWRQIIDDNGVIYESVGICRSVLGLCWNAFRKKTITGELRYVS